MTATWAELGLHRSQPVRDLWLQKDLGAETDRLTATVPAHGAILVKIGSPRREARLASYFPRGSASAMTRRDTSS